MSTEMKPVFEGLCLMYGGSANMLPVDSNQLGKGIYVASTPCLFRKETNIEDLAEMMKNYVNAPEEYIENLKRCELKEVQLIFKP